MLRAHRHFHKSLLMRVPPCQHAQVESPRAVLFPLKPRWCGGEAEAGGRIANDNEPRANDVQGGAPALQRGGSASIGGLGSQNVSMAQRLSCLSAVQTESTKAVLGCLAQLVMPRVQTYKESGPGAYLGFPGDTPSTSHPPPPPSSPIAAKWATGAIAWRRFRRAKASGLPLPLPLPPFVFTLWARASPPRADSKGRPQRKTAPPSTRLGDKCGCDRSFVGRCALPPATTTRVHHDCAPLESRAPLSAGHRHGPDRGCPSVMLCHTCMPD